MKKIKFNLLAIIGMTVAVATLAFTAPKENHRAPTWYETDANGYLEELTSGPEGDCDEFLTSGHECAIQLSEPVAPMTKRVDVDPNDIIETAFREEP